VSPADNKSVGLKPPSDATRAARAGSAPETARYLRALEGLLGVPATAGNRIDVLRNGDQIFPAMLEAIRWARSTIDFLTFIYWECAIGEEFADALAERARSGVRVRVLLDAIGAYTIDRRLVDRLKDAGAQVEWFRPVPRLSLRSTNHRSHRKVLICDEEVAFTGGVGIADEWRGDARNADEWRDTHFRVRGPAVDGLRAAFVDEWVETGRPLFEEGIDRFPAQPETGTSVVQVLRGAAEPGWSDITILVRVLLVLARDRLRIATAYFVPDDDTAELLCAASRRGVAVEILVPGPHADKRFVQLASESDYQRLLDAGVQVSEFLPSMLHAKVMTVDGVVAVVGSANFNSRSLRLDDEINLTVFDPALVDQLDAHFDEDLARSRPIHPSRWTRRPLRRRVLEEALAVAKRYF
jgi:cardiolipin synthase